MKPGSPIIAPVYIYIYIYTLKILNFRICFLTFLIRYFATICYSFHEQLIIQCINNSLRNVSLK